MQIFLTQLQGFNAAFRLLDYYGRKADAEEVFHLAGDMVFLADGNTADPALWEDWTDAIGDKKKLTKQEAFDGMIKFLDIYRSLGEEGDVTILIDKLNEAKDCDDISVPIVKQWNLYVKEVLSEPEGTREYLSFGDPMENITQLPGFNTIYKLLVYYSKEKKSAYIARLAENMLFLPDGDTTVDPAVWYDWSNAIKDKWSCTKQEVFEGAIQFLEAYGSRVDSSEAKFLASELRSAKNCDDMSVPLVELWNFCLVEALNEPGGMINYKE